MTQKLPERIWTIEVANKGNSPHIFAPTKDRLQGRWDFANNANRDLGSSGLKALAMEFRDGIPGQCVQVDTVNFVGRIFWPQSMEGEGKDIAKRMARIYQQHRVELGAPPTFEEPKEFELTADDMKMWLAEMSQMVETGKAVYVAGSETDLPSRVFIEQLPGKMVNGPFAEGPKEGTGEPTDNRPVPFKHVVKVPSGYGVDHAERREFAEAQKEEAGAGAS